MGRQLTLLFLLPLLLFAADQRFDVVIPAHPKDLDTLEYVISGIKENGIGVRRVIVVSKEPLTENAEWVSERDYPFTKSDVAELMGRGPDFERVGWYYQQLLKLYVFEGIPDLLDNVLILDADTVFCKKVPFVDERGNALLSTRRERCPPYKPHMERLLPGLTRVHEFESGIAHHILLQRDLLYDLINRVEHHHQMPLWKAFIAVIDPKSLRGSGASEYEIYFNFVQLFHPSRFVKRKLAHRNAAKLDALKTNKRYHYISFHTWYRRNRKL
ncbi:MAG: DUF6492 family protein [Simkaniaceae bacterium]|nr:DUF6492 family protein [Simkaniaceae bacterium]